MIKTEVIRTYFCDLCEKEKSEQDLTRFLYEPPYTFTSQHEQSYIDAHVCVDCLTYSNINSLKKFFEERTKLEYPLTIRIGS